MVYFLFNPKIVHDETCEFETFQGMKRRACGELAVGRRGGTSDTRLPLCQEHFDYCASLDGVAQYEIKREVYRG